MRLLRALGALLLGAALLLATAEVVVRVVRPAPRAQVIRGAPRAGSSWQELTVVHGQPIWRTPGSDARQEPACVEGATEVLLLGSSIFFGIDLPPGDVVGARLQERLSDQGEWCVRNHAQPGFVGAQQLALARELVPELRPAVVVWEVWMSLPGGYTMLGDDAYNLTGVRVDEAGYPTPRVPMPAALHHWLFHHSRAWEYASIALAPWRYTEGLGGWARFPDEQLAEARRLVEANGGELLVVLMPWLDRAFETSVAEHRDAVHPYSPVIRWTDAQDVSRVDVAAELVDRDPAELRLDRCCHLAPAGHEALAAILAPRLRSLATSTGAMGEGEAQR